MRSRRSRDEKRSFIRRNRVNGKRLFVNRHRVGPENRRKKENEPARISIAKRNKRIFGKTFVRRPDNSPTRMTNNVALLLIRSVSKLRNL